MRVNYIAVFIIITLGFAQEPSTREMNLINWLEFQKLVPTKIRTVLLPVGTLEPHGVIPNGSDNIAPDAMTKFLAPKLNAMIAPGLNYGITGTLQAYPGAFAIQKESYRLFVTDILNGLANNKFKNIIIINGHGGPQTAVLQDIALTVSAEKRVRIMVLNWWSLASKATFAVFDENGGHAGNNETAYIQAIVPKHIHPEWYKKEMATAYPQGSTWFAAPFPSSIGLYQEGQGFPTFDEKQATDYFRQVNQIVLDQIEDVIKKWDMAKLYE
ncbi:MAG: creatininase family protein [Calditrichaeota bacterium]|nr:creatininase family protein [Calditrichota bacterium]